MPSFKPSCGTRMEPWIQDTIHPVHRKRCSRLSLGWSLCSMPHGRADPIAIFETWRVCRLWRAWAFIALNHGTMKAGCGGFQNPSTIPTNSKVRVSSISPTYRVVVKSILCPLSRLWFARVNYSALREIHGQVIEGYNSRFGPPDRHCRMPEGCHQHKGPRRLRYSCDPES